MTVAATRPQKDGAPRWQAALGIGLVTLSVIAAVISLGAPGIGWMLAVVTLYAGGLSAPRIGRGQLFAVLVIALLHLYLLVPFAGFRLHSGKPAVGAVFFFVALPLATVLLALCLPRVWRGKKLISRRP